jgi:2-polyprenyl-6-hydroxyphenyl methylase/3-demethylubiquinone-9 3-methyltransferase
MTAQASTIDPEDIARFAAVSDQWWDESGPFAPIHRINPVRLGYIKSTIARHFGRDDKSLQSLKALKILDIGCGGGLVCEPLSRLGAIVTGIDADENAIHIARMHAAKAALTNAPTYICTHSEDMAAKAKGKFDAVLALEIVEHVADVETFVRNVTDLCKPGGVIIFSTLNKTIKSMLMAKIGAEYILRWVPAGTHDWKKFLRPSTLSNALRRAGAVPFETKGLVFNPLKNAFAMSDSDLDVNYFIAARKEE